MVIGKGMKIYFCSLRIEVINCFNSCLSRFSTTFLASLEAIDSTIIFMSILDSVVGLSSTIVSFSCLNCSIN